MLIKKQGSISHYFFNVRKEEVMEDGKLKVKANGAALLPFILFVLVYLATGLILNARGVEIDRKSVV